MLADLQLPGLDLADASRRLGGRDALLVKLLHALVVEEGETVRQVREQWARGDGAAAGRTAHALRGLAINLGCVGLAAAAHAIEEQAVADPSADLGAPIAALEAAFAQVTAAVARLPAPA